MKYLQMALLWSMVVSMSVLAEVSDPLEAINRPIFVFNDTADRYLLKPVAKGYQAITPDVVEQGIGNMFANLRDVTSIVNNLLQFKFTGAASDAGRVVLNTTVGVAGLFDVASGVGLAKQPEDFGQTLSKWGVGAGPYIVVPLFGPYTLRSGVGALFDGATTDIIAHIDDVPTRNQAWGTRIIDDRAELLAAEQLITGDRYTFIRDAYLQRRESQAKDGAVEDDFGDEDFEVWEE